MKLGYARAWSLTLWLVCAVSCDQCGDEVVAEIASAHGDVQRDHRAYPGQFTQASLSEVLHLGDGLRTGPGSEAELKLFPEGTARIQERTLVRFMSERPRDGVERLTIEEGVIEIDATAVDLELDTGHGIARVKPGSRIRVRASEAHDVQLDVLVGRVAIERSDQTTESAVQGQTIALATRGKATAAATSAAPGSEPTPPGASSDGVATAQEAADDGEVEVAAKADFKLNGFESAIVHVPTLPLEVAFPIGACPQARKIEIGSGVKRRVVRPGASATEIAIRLRAGAQRLRIRCGKDEREITLRVVRDAATQELPRAAPKVEVAADGRRYTVRYQNLLPAVAFSWPSAPAAPSYELVLQRKPGREQRFATSKAQRQLRSGELAEGEYTFAFHTRSGAHSPDSTLKISFDNTARSAYLSSPAEGAQARGQIAITGGALVRSEVSVGGVPVPADAQGRFTATVPHSPSEHAIAVRVSHPSTGVHYYVRRLR